MTQHTSPRHLDFGNRLLHARRKSGLSQMKLCGAVGISHRHMVRLEKGHHFPSETLLVKFVEALHVSRSELVGDAEEDDESSMSTTPTYLELLDALRPLGRLFSREAAGS